MTVDSHQLHRYMAVTNTALVLKFDFTRFASGSFMGWHNQVRSNESGNDLVYHGGRQCNASYVNGSCIVRPLMTADDVLREFRAEWDDEGKQYATFKAHDWKNNRLAEISCSPSCLASYFEKDSPLPFQVTPAFFRPEVLQKYKADPEKYRLEHRSISSRAGWYLKSYDVNDAGQVHAYLCDLGHLPYHEQLYWQSFNEWPKSPISERAYQTDFEANWSTLYDPLEQIKSLVRNLDARIPVWWSKRGETLSANVHYPLTASIEEWSNAILALDQLIVEGLSSKALKNELDQRSQHYDKNWGSIRMMQEIFVASGETASEAEKLVDLLKRLHFLRNKVKGHAAETEKQKLIKQARTEFGSLKDHFRELTTACHEAFDSIIDRLGV